MKKTGLIAVLLLVMASISFFTSCTTEEEDLSPTIKFVTGSGYVSSDATLSAGEVFTVNISATANSTSGAKLTNLKVVRNLGGNAVTYVDQDVDQSSFTGEMSAYAAFIVGTEKWTFTVTDANGETAEIVLNITTTAGGEINTFTQKILGSYGSAYGSFFASADGSVYNRTQAFDNQSKVDWCYFYGVENAATIAAPNNDEAKTVYHSETYGLQYWTTLNATLFSKVELPDEWDNIVTDAQIIAVAGDCTESKINQIAVGDVLAFKTVSGKLGLIRVTDIATGAAGSITYNVKVQK